MNLCSEAALVRVDRREPALERFPRGAWSALQHVRLAASRACGELEQRITRLRAQSVRQISRRKSLCVLCAQIQHLSGPVQQQAPHRMQRGIG